MIAHHYERGEFSGWGRLHLYLHGLLLKIEVRLGQNIYADTSWRARTRTQTAVHLFCTNLKLFSVHLYTNNFENTSVIRSITADD